MIKKIIKSGRILFFFNSVFAIGQSVKPNIIYIFTDQQTAKAMSCVGNTDLHTPNIDRLAEEGIRFTNAYCSTPLSTPSRAAMFTGFPSGYIQTLKNASSIPEKIKPSSLGNLLSANGYDCVYGGKWHLPEPAIESPEWGFRVIHGYDERGLAESAVDFINERHLKPFFLVASFVNPHNICEFARGQKLPQATIVNSLPEKYPALPENFEIPQLEPEAIRTEQKANNKAYPTSHFSTNDWRLYIDTYYRLVEHIDTEIGKILTALERNHLLENSIIIFSSDHGDGLASHKWNQKSVLYEESVNIPFIVRLPGAKNKGEVRSQLVNNGIDFYASICDYSGIKLPENRYGKSLKPISLRL